MTSLPPFRFSPPPNPTGTWLTFTPPTINNTPVPPLDGATYAQSYRDGSTYQPSSTTIPLNGPGTRSPAPSNATVSAGKYLARDSSPLQWGPTSQYTHSGAPSSSSNQAFKNFPALTPELVGQWGSNTLPNLGPIGIQMSGTTPLPTNNVSSYDHFPHIPGSARFDAGGHRNAFGPRTLDQRGTQQIPQHTQAPFQNQDDRPLSAPIPQMGWHQGHFQGQHQEHRAVNNGQNGSFHSSMDTTLPERPFHGDQDVGPLPFQAHRPPLPIRPKNPPQSSKEFHQDLHPNAWRVAESPTSVQVASGLSQNAHRQRGQQDIPPPEFKSSSSMSANSPGDPLPPQNAVPVQQEVQAQPPLPLTWVSEGPAPSGHSYEPKRRGNNTKSAKSDSAQAPTRKRTAGTAATISKPRSKQKRQPRATKQSAVAVATVNNDSKPFAYGPSAYSKIVSRWPWKYSDLTREKFIPPTSAVPTENSSADQHSTVAITSQPAHSTIQALIFGKTVAQSTSTASTSEAPIMPGPASHSRKRKNKRPAISAPEVEVARPSKQRKKAALALPVWQQGSYFGVPVYPFPFPRRCTIDPLGTDSGDTRYPGLEYTPHSCGDPDVIEIDGVHLAEIRVASKTLKDTYGRTLHPPSIVLHSLGSGLSKDGVYGLITTRRAIKEFWWEFFEVAFQNCGKALEAAEKIFAQSHYLRRWSSLVGLDKFLSLSFPGNTATARCISPSSSSSSWTSNRSLSSSTTSGITTTETTPEPQSSHSSPPAAVDPQVVDKEEEEAWEEFQNEVKAAGQASPSSDEEDEEEDWEELHIMPIFEVTAPGIDTGANCSTSDKDDEEDDWKEFDDALMASDQTPETPSSDAEDEEGDWEDFDNEVMACKPVLELDQNDSEEEQDENDNRDEDDD